MTVRLRDLEGLAAPGSEERRLACADAAAKCREAIRAVGDALKEKDSQKIHAAWAEAQERIEALKREHEAWWTSLTDEERGSKEAGLMKQATEMLWGMINFLGVVIEAKREAN